MKCLNLKDPRVANLVSRYGEVMTSKILDGYGKMGFPTDAEADNLYQTLSKPDFSLSIQPVSSDISEIKRVLMNPNVTSSTNFSPEKRKFEIKNALLSNFDKNGNFRYSYYGKKYTVNKDASPSAINEIVEEIYRDMQNWEQNLKDKWVNFFSSGADTQMAAESFGKNAKGESLFDVDIIDRVKAIVNYNERAGDKITRLSKLGDIVPDAKVDNDFIGDDPLVVVHKSDSGHIELSIYDVTSRNLEPSKSSLLFERYMSTATQKQLNLRSLTSSEKGIRDFNLTLLAMQMRNANNKVRFRQISTLQINKQNIERGLDIKLTPSGVLGELDRFLNTKEGKKFLSEIPSKFATLLSNKRLLNIDYGQSYIELLKNEYRKSAMREGIPGYEEKALNNIADNLFSFISGNGNLQDIIAMLRARDKALSSLPDNSLNEFQKKEKLMISKTLMELTSPKMKSHNTMKDIKGVSFYTEIMSNISNPVIQWVAREYNSSGRKIVDAVFAHVKEHNKLLEDNINLAYFTRKGIRGNQFAAWTIDSSNERFERLWKYVDVKDGKTGKMVKAKSMMIHHDLNDPETKAKIASGQLTKLEVEYGAFAVKSIREYLIKGIEHQIIEKGNYKHYDENTPTGKLKIREMAETEYKRTWTDGMVPLMNKTVAARIFSGDFKGGFSKLVTQLANSNALLTETHSKEDEEGIENKFLYQLGSEVDSDSGPKMNIGNINNAERLGIIYNPVSKEWVLDSQEANDDVSTDLEMIIKYLSLVTERKIEYDKNFLPTLNNARTMLYEEKQQNAIDWLDAWKKRVIYAKSPKVGIDLPTPLGKTLSVDALLNATMKGTAFTTQTFNIPVGITSAAVNTFVTVATGIAQGMSGSHLYGPKELRQALAEIAKDPSKAEAIAQMYHVTEMNEHDMVNNLKYQKTKAKLYQSKTMNFWNYAGDYGARIHVMVAQMIKDGTWDAHIYNSKTGELKYDEKLDSRYYKNGKLTEEGKLLKESVRQGLIQDGAMTANDTENKKAYDNLEAVRIKDVGDQIMFSLDPANRSNLENYWLGRMFLQYKHYLTTKAGQIYSEAYGRDASGQRIVVKNEETGELEVQWQPEYFEGKYQTFVFALKELGSLKQKPTEFWVNLQPRQRANIVKLCTDVMLASIMFMMYSAFDDDDEYKYGGRNVPMTRFKKIWTNTNRDLINDISPAFWLETMKTPFASVSIIHQLGTSVYALMNADITKAAKTPYPGKSTVELIKETFE